MIFAGNLVEINQNASFITQPKRLHWLTSVPLKGCFITDLNCNYFILGLTIVGTILMRYRSLVLPDDQLSIIDACVIQFNLEFPIKL